VAILTSTPAFFERFEGLGGCLSIFTDRRVGLPFSKF
jgi:hypothetical protein